MKRPQRFASRLAAAAGVMLNAAHGGRKVTICHVPPGNPGNAHTISVSANAWGAHQAHGDTMGECSGSTPPGEEQSGGGGGPSGGNSFVVVLCDGRAGAPGQQIQVSGSGRAMVAEAECN